MSFYEDRVSIINMNEKEVYLFKNKKNEISMDYYNLNDGHNNISICEDAYGEFDIVAVDEKINLIYQNTKNDLKLLVIDKLLIEEIDVETEKLPKTYEIKIVLNGGIKSIIYLTPKFSEKGVFEIYHQIFKDEEWIKFKVDETRISKFLNPIKILNDETTIYLFFYYGDQICMKEFDVNLLEWKETIVLTDSVEKLDIDVIKDGRYIHLVYCEYIDQNLNIKYKKYEYRGDSLYEIIDRTISNEGNNTHPTIILNEDKIWIVWKDTLGLNSSFSSDKGESFSTIYLWKKTKTYNYVRYNYKQKEDETKLKLNHSFGTIYPDIKFLGFGELKDVEEVKLKKRRD
ncbi:hypothetical protein [Tissierella creatinophila]|uniref:BNR/Asp-box repeat protein n=1 Tax=Tissierella creatinophila DSM 6911 TaxID=1123403 RepID=A0A1U7M6J4_TISCR|nr:hypothetical protein [Tissierella creatinophila]OLS02943.1 hypothetical protein TICRE_10970 [Tissierella creatinophila DSM 6911]